ncbi:hypothetical protein L6164_021973 [Bauhinia variegata]|uniref:Uncharacterized protein n=1 Tax=Bauhinia variegata TaxID=167791 RepID=A0ACB9MF75_BAUVA|nr:hypothetical protein L6164_021973 [Bauhinia variegata]
MTPVTFSTIILFSLVLLSIAAGQERAPHGLGYENPEAFTPSAYDFFHPNAQKPENKDPCAASKCSPLPLAALVEDTRVFINRASTPLKFLGIWDLLGLGLGLGLLAMF